MGSAVIPAIASGLGSIFAPEGQRLSSFENSNNANVNPAGQAANLGQYLQSYLQLAAREAGAPVTAQTTVAPLPSFGGGGLPFDIAAPAVDPNRMDASRRTIPGLPIGDLFGSPSPAPPPDGTPDPGGPWTPDSSEPGHGTIDWTKHHDNGPIDMTKLDPGNNDQWNPGSDEPVSRTMPGPDLDQAEGAIALLMAQLQGSNGSGGTPAGPRRRQLMG